jgi:hypothetical protein
MAIDLERLAEAAADSFLHGGDASRNEHRGSDGAGRRKFGTAGAVVVGVGLGLATRAVIRRVRNVDLEQIGEAIENKLERR